MRAVVLRRHGDPSVLERADLPEPTAGPGQAVVEVRACAVNRLDLWVRGGLPGVRLPLPHVLGSDIAGVVSAVGPGVDAAWIGREVVVSPGTSCGACEACLSGWDNLCPRYAILGEQIAGGYCERLAVPAANLLPKPAGLDFVAAAAVPLTFLTAWQMLVVRAQVRPGQSVLIHAVGSGVGVAGLQIARLHGARVIALASSEAKLARARELGAEATLLSGEGWEQQVRALPFVGKRGVDVVFEHTGPQTWGGSLLSMKRGARLVTCGSTTGIMAQTNLHMLFQQQLRIFGSFGCTRRNMRDAMEKMARGEARPVIDTLIGIDDFETGLQRLESRQVFGKIVVTL